MTGLMKLAGRTTTIQAGPNLIENGSFVGHADGWYKTFASQTETLSYEDGALVLESAVEQSEIEAIYRPRGTSGVLLNGLTTIDLVGTATYTSETEGSAQLRYELKFYDSVLATTEVGSVNLPDPRVDVLNGEGPIAFAERDVAVPEGSTHLLIHLKASVQPESRLELDDLYVGLSDGDAPPYPAVALPLDERFANGTFATGIEDWEKWNSTETISWISQRLYIECIGGGGEGVYSPAGIGQVVRAGDSMRFRTSVFGDEGVGEIVFMSHWTPSATAPIWTGVPSESAGSPTLIDETFAVPAGKFQHYLSVETVGTDPMAFTLDGVSLVNV